MRAIAAALALVLLWLAPAGAQDPGDGAPLWLPADHWVHPVFLRLSATGLLAGEYEPAVPGMSRAEALRLLDAAGDAARADSPRLVEWIAGYRERLAREFPETPRGAAAGRPWAARWGLALRAGEPRPLTSVGTPPVVPQPWEPEPAAEQPPSSTDGETSVGASLRAGRWLALELSATAGTDRVRVEESYVVVDPGVVSLWAGRRRLSLGPGDEGVIVSGRVPLDGVGVAVRPFELPWLLRLLGTVDLSTALSQLHHSAPYDDPWLWLLRVGIRPHERVSLSLHRAAMAVPVEGGFGDRLQQIAYIAIGKHLPDAEENWRDNQMASVALRYRPPLGRLPLLTYIEWGLDDSAGSWKDVPGIVGGAYLGTLPGLSWVGAGIEGAHFAPRCCGNIWWYRHTGFQGGWTDQRQPLGHALGGHGDQWTLRLDAGPGSGSELGAQVFWRNRGDENLYAPTFEGESRGLSLTGSAAVGEGMFVGGSGELEAGDEWNRGALRIWVEWVL